MTTPSQKIAHITGRQGGFSLIEVLISLALLAALLTAIAYAMQGSASSYSQNDEISAMTQTARSVLSKMAHEIRASNDTSFTGTHITIFPIASGSGLTQIEYNYQNGNLNYITTVNGVVTSYPLITSTEKVRLSAFTVARTQGVDANNTACTAVLTASMTFTAGRQTFNVTASAAPRRNQHW
jgi:prepilin-type N-terminal cleavage/methylation domain-containing protein